MSKRLENIEADSFGKFEGHDLQGISSITGGCNQTQTTCEKTTETCTDRDGDAENNDSLVAAGNASL